MFPSSIRIISKNSEHKNIKTFGRLSIGGYHSLDRLELVVRH